MQFWLRALCGTILRTYLEFGPVVQGISFKDISYLELQWPSCSVKHYHLGTFGRGNNEKQFCEIILNLNKVVQEELSFKDISYLKLLWPSCSAEQNHLRNFGSGHYENHFCQIILNLDQWFRRSCCFKIFHRAMVAILFS